MAHVRKSATKVLLFEEAAEGQSPNSTIDDGAGNPVGGTNLLSVRHDKTAKYPEASKFPLYNAKCKGNVVFCDAHADYVPRSLVNDPNNVNAAIYPFW